MLMVTEFIFMAVSVSCRALLRCCKAMLSVLCRNVPSNTLGTFRHRTDNIALQNATRVLELGSVSKAKSLSYI